MLRALIDATTEKRAQFVTRKLDDVELVAMFIDGIEFAGLGTALAIRSEPSLHGAIGLPQPDAAGEAV